MDGQNRIREGKLAAPSQARKSERGSVAMGEKLRVKCQPLPERGAPGMGRESRTKSKAKAEVGGRKVFRGLCDYSMLLLLNSTNLLSDLVGEL